jgi:N-formylglutamate amidohydrolase
MNDEIDYLISSVGKGGCKFIRNGTQHLGRDARAHLESKRRHNAHLFDSTEEFIDKIASKSAQRGKPYLIKCRAKATQTAAEWFTALLIDYRGSGFSRD